MELYRRARGVLPFVFTFITPLIIRTVDQNPTRPIPLESEEKFLISLVLWRSGFGFGLERPESEKTSPLTPHTRRRHQLMPPNMQCTLIYAAVSLTRAHFR